MRPVDGVETDYYREACSKQLSYLQYTFHSWKNEPKVFLMPFMDSEISRRQFITFLSTVRDSIQEIYGDILERCDG